MIDIDVTVEDPRWGQAGFQALAERAAQATIACFDIDAAAVELSILACDDARIAQLNADFREKPTATNVLSWPATELRPKIPGDPPTLPEPDFENIVVLGDIAISYDTCAREAAAAVKVFDDHVTHLIVHGMLHLFGYDHMDDTDAALMERVEVKILGKLGLSNPYKEE